MIHGKAAGETEHAGGTERAPADGASGDGNIVIGRVMGGVEYGRPLATGWNGTLGVTWQRARCMDEHGNTQTKVGASNSYIMAGKRPEAAMTAWTGNSNLVVVGR